MPDFMKKIFFKKIIIDIAKICSKGVKNFLHKNIFKFIPVRNVIQISQRLFDKGHCSVLKRDRDPESGLGGIGIGNFDLGRDRAGSGLEIST
jgi:hypothetical protein